MKKEKTIANIKYFINNTSDPLIYWDELYRSLLSRISHKKLKELEEAYYNEMDKDMQKTLEDETTFNK
tara:strand:+ start:447 stop:650 length:204 start_codon:yes stop_codon:yes gene_type:complete